MRDALRDWESFCSACGVVTSEEMSQTLRGGGLCSDGTDPDARHRVLISPPRPHELAELSDTSRVSPRDGEKA
ncbi:MAG TPA: hypothetical protein VGD73_32765 [Pseudonocardia sp.]|uniref:hypothetical protein n=1 Tax=Pseudonocardia sp. TaxID=60912 RepID=UPI002EDAD14F